MGCLDCKLYGSIKNQKLWYFLDTHNVSKSVISAKPPLRFHFFSTIFQ